MQIVNLFIRSMVEDGIYIPESSLYNIVLESYRLYRTSCIPKSKFYWEMMYLYYTIKFAK